jgi:hypothetical protein
MRANTPEFAQQLDIFLSRCLLTRKNEFTVLGFGNCQCGDVIGRVLDAPITRVQGCPKNSFDSPVGVNH